MECLDLYRRAHRGMPKKITREEEYELIRKAQTGDLEAETRLIRQNIPFVFMLAREYKNFEVLFEDLIQEGMMALSKSIRTFDTGKGVRLSTYASWWIHAHMGKFTRTTKTAVTGPASVSYGKSFPYISVVSLNVPLNDDHDASTMMDLLEDESDGPEDMVSQWSVSWQVRRKLNRLKKRLTPVQIDVMENRLLKDEPDQLGMIGARHNLSRERIRQIDLELRKMFKLYLEEFASAA